MFTRISHLLRRRGARPGPLQHAHALSASPPAGIAHSRVYQQSPWVYVAVNRIAEAAALVPLRVLRQAGGRAVEAPDHPLAGLLARPNSSQSGFELMEATVGMLELHGNAYWFLGGREGGAPEEIWPLAPDHVQVLADASSGLRGYLYEVDGVTAVLEPAEVIHFRRWHPSNTWYGLSALEAARLAILSDRAMAEWNQAAFGEDHGVPAGMVVVRDFISDGDFERLKRDWRDSYGSGQRRTAFLRGDSVSWQNIGLSHHDLDFLNGRAAHREEILNIFGVPLGMLSENATEANAAVAERVFVERTLWPKLARIAAKLNAELLPFWGAGASLAFDDIRPTDTQARLEELRAAYPVLSINEIRERYYHLPPVAWGSVPAAGGPQDGGSAVAGDHLGQLAR
jgi:HK97 family phage portal protein